MQLLLAALNRDDRVTMVLSDARPEPGGGALPSPDPAARRTRVIAQGPTEEVLTPETVRALVRRRRRRRTAIRIAGHLTVTPLARVR